ncbi:glycosyltransferase family 2 protein [Burkholderia gladioli]|uniref:glycosyltransferase family 2 protein n=1 Tax=Burkholderia gladioli TaxID=28095 RepID=UPI00265060DF|nr:glycosyltransferase [Burkholderia gladioli]MDN7718119.1 glycosyltransferase [Burkholderia gladioli]
MDRPSNPPRRPAAGSGSHGTIAAAREALEQARTRVSPRLTPRGTTLASVLIHGTAIAVWVLLLTRALVPGLVSWSVGIAYVIYDTLLLSFVAFKILPLAGPISRLHAPARPAPGARQPSLGVVVAAYNEASVIKVTLDGLFSQSEPLQQIIFADDGSTDDTIGVLTRQYGLVQAPDGELSAPSTTHPNLRWLRVPHGGKAAALNAALLHIETDAVMTVDADTRLARDACAAMRRAFAAEPALVAATGILTPICARTLSGRFFQWFQTYEYIRNFISRFAWMRADSLLLISGAFACFRLDALLKVGGFDGECLVEDYELIHRLRRYAVEHGETWRVRVIGDAHAHTDAPGTLRSFLRQRRRWFAGFLQTQYWNRDMTGNRRYGQLGMLMLPVKALDTLQPIYGLTAIALLFVFLVEHRFHVALSISGVIAAKIVIDFAFHLWSIHLYRRWTGYREQSSLAIAFVASVLEPFSFQVLRHTGAALGWVHFLRGNQRWGAQERTGLVGDGN